MQHPNLTHLNRIVSQTRKFCGLASKVTDVEEESSKVAELSRKILDTKTGAAERLNSLSDLKYSINEIDNATGAYRNTGNLFTILMGEIDTEIKEELDQLPDDEKLRAIGELDESLSKTILRREEREAYKALFNSYFLKKPMSSFPLVPLARAISLTLPTDKRDLLKPFKEFLERLEEKQIQEFGPKWMDDILQSNRIDLITLGLYRILLLKGVPADLHCPEHQNKIYELISYKQCKPEGYFFLKHENAIPWGNIRGGSVLSFLAESHELIAEDIEKEYGKELLEMLDQFESEKDDFYNYPIDPGSIF